MSLHRKCCCDDECFCGYVFELDMEVLGIGPSLPPFTPVVRTFIWQGFVSASGGTVRIPVTDEADRLLESQLAPDSIDTAFIWTGSAWGLTSPSTPGSLNYYPYFIAPAGGGVQCGFPAGYAETGSSPAEVLWSDVEAAAAAASYAMQTMFQEDGTHTVAVKVAYWYDSDDKFVGATIEEMYTQRCLAA